VKSTQIECSTGKLATVLLRCRCGR